MILKTILVFCISFHIFNFVSGQVSTSPVRDGRRGRGGVPRIRSQFTDQAEPERKIENDQQEEEPTDNNVITLLQKINDRLTAMSALNDQQMRRFETFEYRLTKLEVQIQEKTEGLRTDLKEIGRRVQQLDWQSSKTESALDSLKSDTTFLKQAVEHFRTSPSVTDTNIGGGGGSDVGLDVSNKLQMVMRGVTTLLNSFSGLQADVTIIRRNLTKITNTSSTLDTILPQLLSARHFQRTLLDLERRVYRPVCAAPASQDGVSGFPRDCSEVVGNKSGVYRIQPPRTQTPFFVYCDLETAGGKWTVIQRRQEGTLEFYKGWHDYKHGFGNLGGEFWLGLEKIYLLTDHKVNEIYIELEDFQLEKKYAKYSAFAVGSEIEGYPISFLGSYDGNAGDSLLYHAGQKFSTFDMDHDNWAEGNCAQSHTGAWWYNGCETSNLNGRYLNGELPDQYEYHGMYWYEWRGPKYSLKGSKIMVRPVDETSTFVRDITSSAPLEND